jgi:Putative phage abortive infection protein
MARMENDEEDNEAFPIWVVVVALPLLLGIGAFVTYGARNPETFISLGAWGDFVGGTLNPILTFLTVIGLLVTIHLQQRELRLTRKELTKSSNALEAQNLTTKKQRFENTLFSMIDMLNQIVNEMDLERHKRAFSGRDCFSFFFEQLEFVYTQAHYGYKLNYNFGYEIKTDNISHDFDRIKKSYDVIYIEYQSDVAHYFRVLYTIFRYVENSEFADGIYSKILRAQLSNQELLIIFYNNITERGASFAALAERFELYDNLDIKRLLRPEHVDLASRESFGKNPMLLPKEREHPS